MHVLVLKFVTPNSNYGQLKKGPQNGKNPFRALAIAFRKSKLTPLRIKV